MVVPNCAGVRSADGPQIDHQAIHVLRLFGRPLVARADRLSRGQVVGQPPFRGVLQHHGWRATRVDLPSLVEGGGNSIVAPAEVELA